MSFFETLQSSTEPDRRHLLAAPLIRGAISGDIGLDTYVEFLHQAYHHVKHTTPLLMAAGARMPGDREWLRDAIAEYIEEERGHQEWILDDIEACGGDRETARNSRPNLATELMVAYAYDTIERISPLGLFGMVLVLEGTSVTSAIAAADSLQVALQLPGKAFTYLRSHGALDQAHMSFFAGLMNRIDDPAEQAMVVHAARVFYRLYGDVLRSVTAGRPATPTPMPEAGIA
ncbi:MAG: TenA family transcriptional regulator [Gammaproteobacteria bacterium]